MIIAVFDVLMQLTQVYSGWPSVRR